MRYGWKIQEIEEKRELAKEKKESEISDVYEEMMIDYYQRPEIETTVGKSQFKRSVAHFPTVNYQEEFNLISYFGKFIAHLDLEVPKSLIDFYPEEEVINLAKIYMRRKEPYDYSYLKKITGNPHRIQFCYTAPKSSFLGKSYFIDRNNYYLLINSFNGIQDAVTLIHESTHIENYLKYGLNLSKYYAELPSITREHYSFDMLKNYADEEEVEKQRILSFYHYLIRAIKLYQALQFIMPLKQSQAELKKVVNHFDLIDAHVDMTYLAQLLSGELEREIGYVLSFIASIDIYRNSSPEKSNIFITSYQIGTRKVTKKVIDRVVPYLLEVLSPYQKVKKI